ncbi:MAG: class I SAM-dependent DNA methyltransferase [Nitrospinota bacterium]
MRAIKGARPYSRLAEIYDQQSTVEFAQAVFERASAILQREGMQPGALVDLACGTGRLANLFAAKGWSVTGVDLSKEMLAIAEKNSRKARAKVKYIHGDMRKWSKQKSADVVLCVYDSLNHLATKSDLQKVFRNVFRTLKPGGIFLFDINNQEFYETYWNGRAEFGESRDYSLIVRLSYSPKQSLGRIESTAFVRKGKLYERIQEVVVERMFTGSEVARMLTEARFRDINAERFNPFSLPYDGIMKTFWSAKKEPA